MASIDLELLRKEDRIFEPLSTSISHSPSKLVDSDADLAADGANAHIDSTAESNENFNSAHSTDEMPEIVSQSSPIADDDFESIYSSNVTITAEQAAADLSLDDAIMNCLLNSHSDDFRQVIRPVSFCESSLSVESSNDNCDGIECDIAELSIPRQIVQPHSTTQDYNGYVSRAVSTAATRLSMVVNNWVQLRSPSDVRSLSVSLRHVWCVDSSDKLCYSQLHGSGLRWFVVATAPAQQVSVSPSGSLVWRLDGGSAYAARNVSARHPWGNKWTEVARDVSWVSVDDHVAW